MAFVPTPFVPKGWKNYPEQPSQMNAAEVIDLETRVTDYAAATVVAGLNSLPPSTAGGTYVHNQAIPATTWTVVHNLGYYPNVAAVDSLNQEFVADVTYIDVNSLQILLTAATAGKVYVS